jgi:Inhibitor of vertebrate lysozyme (Ivy)
LVSIIRREGISMHRTAFCLLVGVVASASIAHAASPDIYIWDVLKRPNYVAAYRRMVSGEKRLPEWIATPDQLARSVTTSAGTVRSVGGNTEEVFSMCKAHECDSKTFVIFFSQYGDVAKSVLRVNSSLRFLGYPTPDERTALISELPPQ